MTYYYRIIHIRRLQLIVGLDSKWQLTIYYLRTLQQLWIHIGPGYIGFIGTWLKERQ